MKTVHPKRCDNILITPGKGYAMNSRCDDGIPQRYQKYAAAYQTLLDHTSAVIMKLTWKQLQPESADKYDWSVIDDVLAFCEKHHKKLHLGLNWLIWSNGPVEDGISSLVPAWVYEAGAKYNDVSCPNYRFPGVFNTVRIPDWEDPRYRELNEAFIEACAKRYDGHPLIETVANFSHGNWGEWHHLDINCRACEKENLYIDFKGRVLDLDFFKYYVDLFPKYFKKTPLIMPVNPFDKEDELEPWAKYAVDTYNYGLKREGLGTIPGCTYAMRYCAGKSPTLVQWQTMYPHYKADGRWSDELYDQQIIDGKLSHYWLDYGGLIGWSYIMEKPHQIRYWANHLGYYYTVTSCRYDKDGAHITIQNDGVAPTYLKPATELAMIKDGQVLKCWQTDEIDLNNLDEKEVKTFHVALPKWEEGAVLGVRFPIGHEELLLAHEKDASGYYLMQDDGNVYVHFDHRPRYNAPLTGEYMGIDFGKQAWCTNLLRNKYRTCLYPDVVLTDYTMEFTLPEGKTLKSISAFGYGALTITDEQGQSVHCELDQETAAFDTHFSGPSGKVKIAYDAPFCCWSIMIIGLVYGN